MPGLEVGRGEFEDLEEQPALSEPSVRCRMLLEEFDDDRFVVHNGSGLLGERESPLHRQRSRLARAFEVLTMTAPEP
jgi:hypothetical protein